MKRAALVVVLALVGCGAAPLSDLQRAALVQRVRDQGDVALGALAKARTLETKLASGKLEPDRVTYYDDALAGTRAETSSLASTVDAVAARR